MKAIILDYGGVIALRKKKEFVPIFPDFKLWDKASCGEIPEEELWKKIEEYTGKTREEIVNILFQEREPNNDVLEFLSKEKGKFKLGIINNGLYRMLEKAMVEWELGRLSDAIVNSSRDKVSKPNPQAFLLACQRLQVQPEDCIFVDDKEKHVLAARALGMEGFVYKDPLGFQKKVLDFLHKNKNEL